MIRNGGRNIGEAQVHNLRPESTVTLPTRRRCHLGEKGSRKVAMSTALLGRFAICQIPDVTRMVPLGTAVRGANNLRVPRLRGFGMACPSQLFVTTRKIWMSVLSLAVPEEWDSSVVDRARVQETALVPVAVRGLAEAWVGAALSS